MQRFQLLRNFLPLTKFLVSLEVRGLFLLLKMLIAKYLLPFQFLFTSFHLVFASPASLAFDGTQTSVKAAVFGFGIPVTDTKRSVEFYTKTLDIGLQQVIPTVNAIMYNETILTFPSSGASIILMQYPSPKQHGAQSGKVVLFVDDVPGVVAGLKKKGVSIMLDIGVLAMVKDPDGFVLELMPSGKKS